MAYQPKFTCDECGAERGPSNHWFIATRWIRSLEIVPWETEIAIGEQCRHLCGQGCVMKFVNRWLPLLANQKLAA